MAPEHRIDVSGYEDMKMFAIAMDWQLIKIV
jgi:hypothetical protein